jgi:Holliday junction resolvase-like predicted endonuclease
MRKIKMPELRPSGSPETSIANTKSQRNGKGLPMSLLKVERITKLGRLGEDLVAERLRYHGYTNIENLNLRRNNYPFGDLLATKHGVRYFIGVKARNEMRQGDVGLNESYNLVLIPDAANARLKTQGKTTDQITSMLLAEVSSLADGLGATAAWATVSIRPRAGTYSGYFGLVTTLGNRRSVPMVPKASATYHCLARDLPDARVTLDLLNS